jgi:NAD(P)H-dependent FMN reductase
MKIACVSSSLDPASRSEKIARLCADWLRQHEVDFINLKDHAIPPFDNQAVFDTAVYRDLHRRVAGADALVLASPVYNWDCGAELKKFVELLGSTSAKDGLRGAFFDKVVTFVNSAGLPHSYMAHGSLALSLMLDFKCIVSPYNIYVHDRQWTGDGLLPEAGARLEKSMQVLMELTALLQPRTYASQWEI